jgi:hypothetical protein
VLLGVDIDGRLFGGKQVVERGVEDADDFGAFIVDDRLRLLIPENRDGEPERGVSVRWSGRWSGKAYLPP